MDAQDIVSECIGRLCRIISQLGNGIQKSVQRNFGIASDGQISRLLKIWRTKPRKLDLRLARFVEICQALGVSPASILRIPGEPVMTAPLPAITKKDRELQPVELAAKDAMTRDCVLEPLDFDRRIEDIDDLRYTSPAKALREIEQLAEIAGAPQVPYVLAVAVSCYRMLAKETYASRCIIQAREAAEFLGDRFAIGELYQRSVYHLDSFGFPTLALECAERATNIYATLDHRQKVGESIIDQGFCYFQLGMFEKCIETNECGGKYHQDLKLRHRFTRLHGIARAYFQLGELNEALKYVIAARVETEGSSDVYLRAKALWTEGAALGCRGVPKIEDAIELLQDTLPIEAALASLDLCRIYLEFKDFVEAHKIAKGMTVFMQPFHHVPVVTKALLELILIGTAAQGLTLTQVARVRKIIQKSRSRYFQRARNFKKL